MKADRTKFVEAKERQSYSPVEDARMPVSGFGSRTVFLAARDDIGNTVEYELPGLVIPGSAMIPAMLIITWGCLLGIILLLAPYSTYCHDLLMNPHIRKIGSFGAIPVLLTASPTLRRHLLKRYIRELSNHKDFKDEKDLAGETLAEQASRFVIPSNEFAPNILSERIAAHRVLLLIGQSGIGKTSYLRYLTSYYLQRDKRRNVVPIFLPIARYKMDRIEDIVAIPLRSYGRLTDKELIEWFLQQGEFMIFVDGLNEVDETTRSRISTFVDSYRKANYIILSSQEAYSGFDGIGKIQHPLLDKGRIIQIIQMRLQLDNVEVLVREFTEETYELYSVPQNLEFAIDSFRDAGCPPLTKDDLYKKTPQIMLGTWASNNAIDVRGLLAEKAYQMLVNQAPLFQKDELQLSTEALTDLLLRQW